jgi:tetratricopeptide (TPR) repeat protein
MANESPSIHATTSLPQVGSVVRSRLIDHPKATRRALVATVQDERTVCILWEDEAPRIRRDANNKPLHRSFLVTPVLKDTADEVESDITVEDLLELLPFETDSVQETDSANDDKDLRQKMQEWKEHGDQLLRLGDATAAAEHYEAALGISRNVRIGSSIILKVGGHTKIAEVDCMDADDNTMDVAIETGEEKTILQSEALITILEPDNDRLQERILLNLARCMLQLAEVTTLQLQRRPLYLRGAVLACTLAISVTCFHNADTGDDASADSVSPTHKSALLLRSQAQVKLSKFKHAKADLKQLLVLDPEHREGQKRLRELEKQQIQKQKTDKRLAKEICQWVGTATEDTVSDPSDSGGDETIAALSLPSTATETNPSITSFSSWFWVGLILLAALIIQKALPGLY